jgi:folate-binding Fe-S cluster repair protein YgfZ
LYAALLNEKGRLVHEFILHHDEQASAGTAVLMDCSKASLAHLKRILSRFKMRADVKVDDASEDLSIVARWSQGLPTISDWDLPDPPGAYIWKNASPRALDPQFHAAHYVCSSPQAAQDPFLAFLV